MRRMQSCWVTPKKTGTATSIWFFKVEPSGSIAEHFKYLEARKYSWAYRYVIYGEEWLAGVDHKNSELRRLPLKSDMIAYRPKSRVNYHGLLCDGKFRLKLYNQEPRRHRKGIIPAVRIEAMSTMSDRTPEVIFLHYDMGWIRPRIEGVSTP